MSRAIWKREPLKAPLIEALNATGLSWEIKPGKKHRKVKGILKSGDCRDIIAAVRRMRK